MYEIELRAEREQKCDREILLHEQLTAQDYLDMSMAVAGNDPAKWDHKLHPKTGLPLEDNKKVFKQHWINGLRDLFRFFPSVRRSFCDYCFVKGLTCKMFEGFIPELTASKVHPMDVTFILSCILNKLSAKCITNFASHALSASKLINAIITLSKLLVIPSYFICFISESVGQSAGTVLQLFKVLTVPSQLVHRKQTKHHPRRHSSVFGGHQLLSCQ